MNNEEEEMENPSYYAIIPAEVRYDKDLKDKAKLLYGEITCLSNKKGYCYASNDYFANLYGVAKETISRLITDLVDKGYVTREVVYKKGTKEIESRYIRISQYLLTKNAIPIDENVNTPIDKNVKTLLTKKSIPIDEKVKENNTSINNININNTSINNTSINNRKENIKRKDDLKEIIDDLVSNEDVKKSLLDFIDMRKTIKKPLTKRALEMIIKKLNTLSSNEEEQREIIDQSILYNWQGIYPIQKDKQRQQKSTGNIFRDIGIEEGIF